MLHVIYIYVYRLWDAGGPSPSPVPASLHVFHRPISLLRLSLLRLLDSNFPGNVLWAWKLHPLELRLYLSQNLCFSTEIGRIAPGCFHAFISRCHSPDGTSAPCELAIFKV